LVGLVPHRSSRTASAARVRPGHLAHGSHVQKEDDQEIERNHPTARTAQSGQEDHHPASHPHVDGQGDGHGNGYGHGDEGQDEHDGHGHAGHDEPDHDEEDEHANANDDDDEQQGRHEHGPRHDDGRQGLTTKHHYQPIDHHSFYLFISHILNYYIFILLSSYVAIQMCGCVGVGLTSGHFLYILSCRTGSHQTNLNAMNQMSAFRFYILLGR